MRTAASHLVRVELAEPPAIRPTRKHIATSPQSGLYIIRTRPVASVSRPISDFQEIFASHRKLPFPCRRRIVSTTCG
jgi:hypothetical protein